MAKKLDDHLKKRLKTIHRLYHKRLAEVIERAEREALIEEMHADEFLVERDYTLDEYEESMGGDPDFKALIQMLRFKARRLVVREFRNIEEKGRKWFFAEYARELAPLERWPTAWMLNSVTLMRNLDRKKNRLFLPLLNYLCKHRLTPQRSHRVMQKIGADGHDTGGRWLKDFVIVKPLDKAAVATALGTSPRQVYRHLSEMVRHGIVKDLGRYGPHDPTVYAVGYYVEFQPGKVKPVWFLKNTKEMRQALRAFDV